MKKPVVSVVIPMVFLFLSSCAPGKLFGPTLTPTPTSRPTKTHTLTPTFTSTSTVTPTETPTPTLTPTPDCSVAAGEWESKEAASFFGTRKPVFVFVVEGCQITHSEMLAYPIPGEMFMVFSKETIEIVDNQIAHTNTSADGTYRITGTFTTDVSCTGEFLFEEGFSVFGAIVPNDVRIPWTVKPKS